MINLDLRFNGPIPKHLTQTAPQASLFANQKAEKIYRIRQAKKNQVKKMFVYPSKNNPISQHEKNLETKGQI